MQDMLDLDSAQGYLTEINTGSPYGLELEKLTWGYCNLNARICMSIACAAISAVSAPSLLSLLLNHLPEHWDKKIVLYLLCFQLCSWGSEVCVWMTGGKGGEGGSRALYFKGAVVVQLINTSFLLVLTLLTALHSICKNVWETFSEI